MEPSERMRIMLNFMGEDGGAVDIPSINHSEQQTGRGLPISAPPQAHVPSALLDGHHVPPAHNCDHMDIDDDQKDEHVASYCGITGADPESARHLLEVRYAFLSVKNMLTSVI
jgi:hypothetical protein